jgi:hypothetical protein
MKKLIFDSESSVELKDNRVRSFFFAWIAAFIGILFYMPVILTLIPAKVLLRFSMNTIVMIVVLQSLIVTAILAAIGAYLSPRIGFRAYLVSVHLKEKIFWVTLKKQFYFGVPIGLIGAMLACLIAPEFISYVSKIPLLARVFYGGLTEEVAMRWCIMTGIVWVLWRIFQKGSGSPKSVLMYSSILLNQIVFASGHIPALKTAGVINLYWCVFTIFLVSLPWGWLYWKRGLEAAMIAHASFHAFIAFFLAIGI